MAAPCHRPPGGRVLFLHAQRETDGVRTYRLLPGVPLPTGHGEDLYQEVSGVRREATLLQAWPAEHGTVQPYDRDLYFPAGSARDT